MPITGHRPYCGICQTPLTTQEKRRGQILSYSRVGFGMLVGTFLSSWPQILVACLLALTLLILWTLWRSYYDARADG